MPQVAIWNGNNDILSAMKYIAVLFFLLLTPIVQAAERPVAVVGAEFWVSPRSGEAVLSNSGISEAVKLLMEDPEAYLVLHHPQSEFGELWGQELQAWLVSLGIVSDRLELRAGFENEGVELVVVSTHSEPEAQSELYIDEIGIDSPLDEAGESAPDAQDSDALILEEWNSQEMLHGMQTSPEDNQSVEQQKEVNERVESDIEAEETESEVPSQDEVELQ